MKKQKNVFITIHGHFYQPPRENPWTEQIELQPSAQPFHNWNARINKECYKANCFARILNSENLIENIINNFQYISFNIGPTLMKWIKENSKETYYKILEADKNSIELYSGHGNAIAQVYNHTILPLAKNKDKHTQILWGIEDFKTHFKREPEAIWLAETAVNQDTIDVLVEFNLKYIILSPFQACKVRPLGKKKWTDVSTGNIDITMPYKQYSRDGRSINIFFYNHTISSAIGFEHLLTNSYLLVEKFQQFIWDANRPILISTCTDGESYGHHEKFGEMCLAHFIKHSSQKHGLTLTNYGQFLELYKPTHEVQIKSGFQGEGTAWSCAHGVGRWIRNCGCSDGGYPSWNQHWRTPLREAFNWLHDQILKAYQIKASHLLKDLQQAKNSYINIISNRNPENRREFLKKFCTKKNITDHESALIFRFMEALYQCQLLFTSCAWFFADISGLEPIQNLKYAARAIQLIKIYLKNDLENDFLNKLIFIKSNNASQGTAKDIYNKEVKSSIINYKMIVSNYAIVSFILNEFKPRKIYNYNIEPVNHEQRKNINKPLEKGMVWLHDNYTGEKLGYIYFLFPKSIRNMRCYTLNNKENFEFNITTIETIEQEISILTNEKYYTIKDLFTDNREQIIKLAFSKQMKQTEKMLDKLYDKNIELLETFYETRLPIPKILKTLCEYVYSNKIDNTLIKQDSQSLESEKIAETFKYANRLGFNVKSEKIQKDIDRLFKNQLYLLENGPNNEDYVKNILEILNLADSLSLSLDLDNYTNIVYKIINSYSKPDQIPVLLKKLSKKLKLAINIKHLP